MPREDHAYSGLNNPSKRIKKANQISEPQAQAPRLWDSAPWHWCALQYLILFWKGQTKTVIRLFRHLDRGVKKSHETALAVVQYENKEILQV